MSRIISEIPSIFEDKITNTILTSPRHYSNIAKILENKAEVLEDLGIPLPTITGFKLECNVFCAENRAYIFDGEGKITVILINIGD